MFTSYTIPQKIKAVTATVGGVATALTAVFADDVFDMSEVGGLLSAVIPVFLTYAATFKVKNAPVVDGSEGF